MTLYSLVAWFGCIVICCYAIYRVWNILVLMHTQSGYNDAVDTDIEYLSEDNTEEQSENKHEHESLAYLTIFA